MRDEEIFEKDIREKNEFEAEFDRRSFICPVCQKQFRIPIYTSLSEYVYRLPGTTDRKGNHIPERKCCSYSCWRKGLK